MITVSQIRDGRAYMRNHLSANDYYSESETVVGHWHGKAAEILGIEGDKVTPEVFEALRSNRHPGIGEKLTPRSPKVAYHDFVVSAPKSVSIAAMVGGDDRVTAAFDRCVARAFGRLEEAACVRVRGGDFVRTENVRQTGNAVAAVYRHDTSRLLDPQLHTHLVFANVTWDEHSERWLALQPKQMAEESKKIRGEFYRELAEECRKLGYGITQEAGTFRIAGIDESLEKRFSQRTLQREKFESRYQATFGEAPGKRRVEQFIKDGKGAATRRFQEEYLARFSKVPDEKMVAGFVQDWRSSKMSKAEPDQVREIQRRRMSPEQARGLDRLVTGAQVKTSPQTTNSAKPVERKNRAAHGAQSKSLAGVRRMKKMMKVNAMINAHPASLMAIRLQQLARKTKHGTQRRIR